MSMINGQSHEICNSIFLTHRVEDDYAEPYWFALMVSLRRFLKETIRQYLCEIEGVRTATRYGSAKLETQVPVRSLKFSNFGKNSLVRLFH